jgi:hypothetical protein
MKNEMKPETELCSTVDKKRKLVWTEDTYVRIWMEHFKKLLNGLTDNEDITKNNYTTENRYIPDKIDMVDSETSMLQVLNKSPKYDVLSVDIIKVAGPIGTQRSISF